MRKTVGFAIAAAMLAVAPGSAQEFIYYNACGPAEGTALRICASADVYLEGSTLRMRVWNMEIDGAAGVSSYSSEFGGWHVITSVGLDFQGPGSRGSGDLSGARYVFGSGADDYQTLSRWHDVDAAGNPLRVEIGSTTEGHREGIVGCTDPNPGKGGHVQTCGSYGFMPFVEFTFTNVDPRIHLGAFNFEFYGWNMYDGYTAKVSAPGVSTEVVPEPITMVLLGSGLVGVGGLRLRRRRDQELDVADDA